MVMVLLLMGVVMVGSRRSMRTPPPLLLHLHHRQRPFGILRIQQIHHNGFELIKLDRLRYVRIETGFSTFGVDVTEDISG
jgi:hypothetical protein